MSSVDVLRQDWSSPISNLAFDGTHVRANESIHCLKEFALALIYIMPVWRSQNPYAYRMEGAAVFRLKPHMKTSTAK